ncbi:MAG TPA: orotate phosphoribosyltransferase [Elusimicrobia bacterium]|nr:orotate phosphoribosyltransferase [Elusimicrobiota bacterium]
MLQNLRAYFEACGALLEGHFILSSGLHSPNYAQCALALKNPAKAAEMALELKARWHGPHPDLILSPAMGGLIIGHETAKAFGVDFLFTERENGAMTLRRGFSLKKDAKVIIVEDVFTTGKSTRETAAVAAGYGATVIGAMSVIDRMGSAEKLEFPSVSLLKMDLILYKPETCPLCAQKLPLIKPGSRSL